MEVARSFALGAVRGGGGTITSGTPTLLATATAKTAYRGIVVTPEPGSVGMILVGLLAFAGKRSRHA